MTLRQWSHLETISQMVVGMVLAQIVLFLFGIPLGEAVWFGVVMLMVSYIRTYLIRRSFVFLHSIYGVSPKERNKR